MKKTIITIGIVFGLGFSLFAVPNNKGGLFKRGATVQEMGIYSNRDGSAPFLPAHDENTSHQDGNAPIGTGIAVLLGFGAAYLIGKRRKQE